MLHLIKLSVGPKDVEELARFQARRLKDHGRLWHDTRMMPKRAAEILEGGSIYWIVAGVLQVRQRIMAIEPVKRPDGTAATHLILEPPLVAVQARPMKPFQGWRYLAADSAPPDLGAGVAKAVGLDKLPPKLRRELMALGLV
ncbi:DUF1489 family protein [Muricoccus radiodurans]|uniref:DUF1489 family protein n=1 Tax=Muricoccus radiodurans TaxID=2231721 RepID=UPI003CF19292